MGRLTDFFTAARKPFAANREFTRALLRMWIAGTMGAYFTFLFRNLALDLPSFALHQIDWRYTGSVWIRYAYLWWFLAYFFVSNVRHEANQETLTKWDVAFALAQAIASFVAAYYLGFIVRGPDNGFAEPTSTAVELANGAIAIICSFSLICFGYRRDAKAADTELNGLRWVGLGSSLVALSAIFRLSSVSEASGVLVGVAAFFGAVPFVALGWFMRIEWKRVSQVAGAT